ncbi:MAG: hydrogenase small subunit [Acidobacteriota bacterium]
MRSSPPSIWEHARMQGFSRRDFLQFCTWLAAATGIEAAGVARVVEALDTSPRLPVVWFHFQECTCCSESFIRSSHPIVADILLDRISLDYTETLMAAAGHQAEAALHDTMTRHRGQYLMLVEGSVPMEADGVYCCIGGRTALDIMREAADGAQAIVAWGSCASNGCIQAAKPNPTGATAVHKLVRGKPVMNVPGCPPIGEVMAGAVVHLLAFGRLPHLDAQGRPRAFYSRRVHDTCYRRPNYDAGLFVESWDDENAKRGYCLYKMGCRGPVTYNACAVTRWNNGVSFPIQSGHGCIGCSEANFWDNGPFYSHLPATGFGIESTADTVGAALATAALGGVAAHAALTAVRKRPVVKQLVSESRETPGTDADRNE